MLANGIDHQNLVYPFLIMSSTESMRVVSHGSLTTVTLAQDQLNHIGLGPRISTHVCELATQDRPSSTSIQLNLDLEGVERITSAGLNELIGINSLARSRGIRLVLLNVQESVREVFALTRLERMFEFRGSTVHA